MKIFVLLLLSLLMVGCSTFDQRWKSESIRSVPDTLAGRWTGEWASFTTHRGELRAIMVADVAPATRAAATQPATRLYHVTFKATYGVIFSAKYSVDFTAMATADGETFSGQKDLGPFAGGLYHYQGTLHQDDLQTTYQSPLDHGTFTLHRVP